MATPIAPPPADTNPDGSILIRQGGAAQQIARRNHKETGMAVGMLGGMALAIGSTISCERRQHDSLACGALLMFEFPAFTAIGGVAGAVVGTLWPVPK